MRLALSFGLRARSQVCESVSGFGFRVSASAFEVKSDTGFRVSVFERRNQISGHLSGSCLIYDVYHQQCSRTHVKQANFVSALCAHLVSCGYEAGDRFISSKPTVHLLRSFALVISCHCLNFVTATQMQSGVCGPGLRSRRSRCYHHIWARQGGCESEYLRYLKTFPFDPLTIE